MKKKPQPNGPDTRIFIDWKKVESYLKAGCSQQKIADSLGIDRETLRERAKKDIGEEWRVYASRMKCKGDVLLEVAQFNSAMEGNVRMLIHLGKHRLGQSEAGTMAASPIQQELDAQHQAMLLQHQVITMQDEIDRLKKELADNGHKC